MNQTYHYNQTDADVSQMSKNGKLQRNVGAVHCHTLVWEVGNNEHQYKCDIVDDCNLIDAVYLEIYNIETHNLSYCDIGGLP